MRFLLIPLLLLAGCDGTGLPEQPGGPAAPPPAALCEQSRKALEQLGSGGGIFYDAKGEATLPLDVWVRMTADQRSQFARLLGLHAACESPDGATERQVLIRSETGTILSRATVPVTIDLDAIE